jgi:hypothetical protein
VQEWVYRQNEGALFLSAVTVGELRKGFILLPESAPAAPNWNIGLRTFWFPASTTASSPSQIELRIAGESWMVNVS